MLEVAGIIHELEKIHYVMGDVCLVLERLEDQEQNRMPYMASTLSMTLDRQSQLLEQLQKELGIAV